MDKIERYSRNETLYKCHFNYVLSKLVDNGLEDLCIRSTIDRTYIDLKLATKTKINHIMVAFTDHYNAIFIDRFTSKI